MIRGILLGLLLMSAPVRAAELTVLTAGAYKSVLTALIPAYEASSGDTLVVRNDTVGALVERIKRNERFDVVIVTPAAVDELLQAGKIGLGSETALAKVGIGVGIREGTPLPVIASVDTFRSAMLSARSVAYIDPTSGGSSGIYLNGLFHEMAIANEMARKSILFKGGLAAEAVADGRAELVIQQISEILAVPGVSLVGPLPSEMQRETIYAGAIAAESTQRGAAQELLGFLSGAAVRPVLVEKGMQPP